MHDNEGDEMTTTQKLMIGVLMLVAWFALVILQMTPVEPFVDALKWAGAGLGLVQATLTDPKAVT